MAKLEVYENKQTAWCGLWWHPESNSFVSPAINISSLRKFKGSVKLVVRKNKYFNGGENRRPNYCFTLRDTESQNEIELKIEDTDSYPYEEDGCYYTGDGERLYTHSEVQRAIDGATRDARSGYTDNIVSDYL